MDHPGIAKVFAAGTTENGDPWFSMEVVRGVPITQYCDSRRLSIEERIALFIEVCRAVQHAHQKGVIHRDLKPSNVLVTEQDGVSQPKIIDFGVAKAIGQQLTDRVAVTLRGTAVGTAAYMSPEQASASGIDVDTRSDIYSLGVMLYELMVGELPLDPDAAGGVHAFLANLAARQTDPPSPSARLSGQHDSAAVAHARRTDPTHLRRELRGDLDWIIMMAMQPDRSLRYESASGLAADLRRHLANEPVVARPPSTRYRVSKFVRRHRLGVAAAAIVAVGITTGGILAGVGFVRARSAEYLAAQEATTARQVTDFLVALFKVNDPGESRGNTLTARQLLDRGSERISSELAAQPLLRARMMWTLGTVHQQLGSYEQARVLFDSALTIQVRELGPEDSLVAQTLHSQAYVAQATGHLESADSLVSRALRIREAFFGPNDINVSNSLSMLATVRLRQNRSAEAESLYKRLLAIDEQVRTPDDRTGMANVGALASVYEAQGKLREADSVYRQVLSAQERALGLDHPDVATTLNNLGVTMWRLNRYEDALGYYQRVRLIWAKMYDPSHQFLLSVENNIGETHWKLGRYAEAESTLRMVLAAKEKKYAPQQPPTVAVTLNSLAGVLRDQQKYREAEPLYLRAIAIRDKNKGTNPYQLIESLRDYAELLRKSGRPNEALKLEGEISRLQQAKQ
jgi:non-specific serine/threonine protein kinase/serine/threonine-protein kinase